MPDRGRSYQAGNASWWLYTSGESNRVIQKAEAIRQKWRLEPPSYTLWLLTERDWPSQEKYCVAYIICEPCVGTKDSACVDVCPVDCIHPRKDEPQFQSAEMLYIHPDECIDCGACVPACPVEAIFALDETPEKWKNFIPVNAAFYQRS